MVEEERSLCQKEIQRLEAHLQGIIETNEAKFFMIKNRILVLAQYLRVKVN